MPKYFRWSDTVVDSCGESYSSAITMGKDPYNGGKNFKVLCENTTGDHTFPYADWRKGSCIEITAEEAESYMEPVVADEDENPPCCKYHTAWDETWNCNLCQVCGSKR